MIRAVRHFLVAVQFFTRIPVTGRLGAWVGYSPAMMRAAAGYYPAVGWLVGGVAAAVFLVVQAALGPGTFAPLVAAALSTLAGILLTGAFHEDGLADLADGLGGSYDRLRALEIMKDSRVGAFGALALCLALVIKVALLGLLGERGGTLAAVALLLGHVLSRGLSTGVIRLMPHVGDLAGSKSKPLAEAVSDASLLLSAFWCAAVLGLGIWQLGWVAAAAALLGGLLAFGWMARLLWRRLQGFTGDGLGATQQVIELAVYLGLALAVRAAP